MFAGHTEVWIGDVHNDIAARVTVAGFEAAVRKARR
jgi:hypothetical protein